MFLFSRRRYRFIKSLREGDKIEGTVVETFGPREIVIDFGGNLIRFHDMVGLRPNDRVKIRVKSKYPKLHFKLIELNGDMIESLDQYKGKLDITV